METYIGVDLGGTNVRVSKVNEAGVILQTVKGPSYGSEGPAKVMPNIIKMIKEIDGYQECAGIGVGVPGPVDTARGIMCLSSNLPGFTGYPIANELYEEFHKPIYLDNDANVAGLAEAMVGAGKGMNIVYYVTISTGIGGALIANGRLVSGKNGYAGEIANIVIDRQRKKVNHLNAGAIECEASGTAIVRKAKELMPYAQINHAGDVFALAANRDVIAIKLVDEITTDLAYMFSIIAHVCDPFAFVIGGGVMKAKEHFLPQVIEKYQALVHEGMRNTLFLEAQLEEPGVIGAAMLPLSMKG
ncbi:MAG: ROK family protein [Erysipelotrichaceae bacterium]|nr:ROK family protein [Erysipelotrichaceae bacterium]MDY5251757.1 ROK family protein [Erysipelotrichaceae bacterium]